MKRERLEDLGRIYQLMYQILDVDSPLDMCESKHSDEKFIEIYRDEEKLCDLHDFLRYHRQALEEIYYLAKGDEE